MTRSLRVHVNRSGHQAVDARTKRFATDGPFVVAVQNHGEGCHVHLRLDGDLAFGDASADDNPFLDAGETLEVPVDVATDLRPADGSVTVTTGYGRNEASVDVRVTEDGATETGDAAAAGADATEPSADDPAAGADDGGAVRARLAGLVTSVAGVGATVRDTGSSGASSGTGSGVTGSRTAGSGAAASDVDPSGSGRRDGDASGSGGRDRDVRPLRERLRPPSPEELGPGTLVLAALAVLAVFAAFLAYASFGSPLVTAAVALVVLTVLGSGLYLLTR